MSSNEGSIDQGSLLDNFQWLAENEARIKALFPETWTHAQNLNMIAIGFHFKLLGLDWRSNEQFASLLAKLYKFGLIEHDPRNKLLIRRSYTTVTERLQKVKYST